MNLINLMSLFMLLLKVMNVLVKAFLASFLFFSLLLAAVIFGEDFINKQGIYYPPLLKNFTTSRSFSQRPLPTPLPAAVLGNGDANANSLVDFGDVHYITSNWNRQAGGVIDQYKDGKINALDFVVVAEQLQKK